MLCHDSLGFMDQSWLCLPFSHFLEPFSTLGSSMTANVGFARPSLYVRAFAVCCGYFTKSMVYVGMGQLGDLRLRLSEVPSFL